MKFTVIITTYNSEKYIEKAITSVLNQVRKPDEIIISDDNSTDNTIDICSKYIPDVRIIVNRAGPSGYISAYNFALNIGVDEYLTILHYDDYLHQDFLMNVEQAFEKHPNCRFLYVGCNYVDQNDVETKPYPWPISTEVKRMPGHEYARKYLDSIDKGYHIHRCPGVVIHKSLISDGLFFRTEAGIINDDDFFLRVGKYTEILGFDYPFASVRLHGDSETGKLEKLSFQLAQDWLFQYEEFFNGNTLLEKSDGDLLLKFSINDLSTSLQYALKKNSWKDMIELNGILEKLESLSGLEIENEINYFYRKLLWRLFKSDKIFQARILNVLLLIGRKIKSWT